MIYELNDTLVPQKAYDDALAIRRKGGKCHLMIADCVSEVINPSTCSNCEGTGEVMIEVITGGPAIMPIPVNPTSGQVTTCIDDMWYKRQLNYYGCPMCQATGKVKVSVEYND